ncbi:MAG: hypothetical protein M3T96_03605 [Acidobacteriota bacterium]|nr:hypothetical protein [Acidobacteriota bacterium]
MSEEKKEQSSEQDSSEGKFFDQEPLEAVEEMPSRLAGNNQIPDFGDDVKGTLQDHSDEESK